MGTSAWLFSGGAIALCGFLSVLWTERSVAKHHLLLDAHHPKIRKVSDGSQIDNALNSSIVLVQDRLDVPVPIQLEDYRLSVHAVKLKRRVQMYQWAEVPRDRLDYLLTPLEDESGGVEDAILMADDVTYLKEWKDELVNFTGEHAAALRDIISNPSFFPVENHVFVAPVVKVGAYVLSDYFKENYFNYFREITGGERPTDPNIKLHAGLYYHSTNLWDPQIGDIRMRFAFAGNGGLTRGKGTPVTVIGQLIGTTLYPFEDENGNLFAILHEDWDSLDEIIQIEKTSRSRPFLAYRLLGFGVFIFGTVWILITLDHMSLQLMFACGVMSVGVSWILHWPFHGLGLLILAGINWYQFFRGDDAPTVRKPPAGGRS